jgi:hypothetical protein
MNTRCSQNAVFKVKAGGTCPSAVMGLYCWNKEWASMTASQHYKLRLLSSVL